MRINFETLFNILLIIGVILISIGAFVFQLSLYELPCPLCLMQRVGFLGIAVGPLLNLRCGFYPSHYSLVLTSALVTAAIALRHVALHVVPGTDGRTTPLLGLHLYTWVFLISVTIISVTSVILGINRQYQLKESSLSDKLVNILFMAILALVLANIVSVILQCGFLPCPDDPTGYRLL